VTKLSKEKAERQQASIPETKDRKAEEELALALAARLAAQRENVYPIAQTAETNGFTANMTRKPTVFDRRAKTATIVEGDIHTIISGWSKNPKPLSESVRRFFDILMVRATEQGLKSTLITLTLTEYMEMRGLTDRKQARRQAIADAKRLETVSFFRHENPKGGERIHIAVWGGDNIIKGDGIAFSISNTLLELLHNSYGGKEGHPMFAFVPKSLLRLPVGNRSLKYAYAFGYKLVTHKRTNLGKPQEGRIKAVRLMKAAGFPTAAEARKSKNRYFKRRLDSFEANMEALSEYNGVENEYWWRWESDEEPKTHEELDEAMIVFEIDDGLEGTKILEGREKHRKKAKRVKQRAAEAAAIAKAKKAAKKEAENPPN
jgi:hypothetical protein